MLEFVGFDEISDFFMVSGVCGVVGYFQFGGIGGVVRDVGVFVKKIGSCDIGMMVKSGCCFLDVMFLFWWISSLDLGVVFGMFEGVGMCE